MSRELHLFRRKMIIDHEQNDARHTNSERNSPDGFRMRFLLGKVMPFAEIESLKRPVRTIEDNLRMSLEKQGQSPSSSAPINGLPKPIQHQHMLVEHRTHKESNLAKSYTRGLAVSIGAGGSDFSPSVPVRAGNSTYRPLPTGSELFEVWLLNSRRFYHEPPEPE